MSMDAGLPTQPGLRYFAINPEEVHRAANDLKNTHTQLEETRKSLEFHNTTSPNAAREILGEHGTAEQYQAYRQAWLNELVLVDGAIAQTAYALDKSANNYTSSDSRATSRFNGR